MLPKSSQWALVAFGGSILVGGAVAQHQELFERSGAAYPLTLRVAGVRSDDGIIRVSVCRPAERFPDECELKSVARASAGLTLVHFASVEEGSYAAAAFHDENDNGRLEMHEARQVPREGVAFSNDAFGGAGVPAFNQAEFEFDGKEQRLRMSYMR